MITELVVAGLAFPALVSTDSPLGAVGGAVGLVIVSNILDAVTALGSWRRSCRRTGSSPGWTRSRPSCPGAR